MYIHCHLVPLYDLTIILALYNVHDFFMKPPHPIADTYFQPIHRPWVTTHEAFHRTMDQIKDLMQLQSVVRQIQAEQPQENAFARRPYLNPLHVAILWVEKAFCYQCRVVHSPLDPQDFGPTDEVLFYGEEEAARHNAHLLPRSATD
jgi:hypothetical protein